MRIPEMTALGGGGGIKNNNPDIQKNTILNLHKNNKNKETLLNTSNKVGLKVDTDKNHHQTAYKYN
jgi:hypothetical protein